MAFIDFAAVDDLEEFNDEDLKAVISNLRKPSGTTTDGQGNVVPNPSYVIGAKSFKQLKIAAAAVRYYQSIGRDITSTNMHYSNVLKNFGEQWEALKAKQESDEPTVPKITRSLPIVKWTESFEDHLHEIIGIRSIPLAYLIREEVAQVFPPPPLLPNRPYSQEHGSVVGELIARANHNNTKYKDDNQRLFSLVEEATRTTQYAASIRPYSRQKDGRGAYLALKAQYAGRDKWHKEIRNQENFIHTRVWKGNTNFSLEAFVTQHRAAHVSLQRCSQFIQHQLPNERTRVTHLMNAIQTTDPSLQAALAHIKSTEDDPNGLMSDFERTAAYIIQFDPVSRKRKSGSRNHQISKVIETDDDEDDEEHKVAATKRLKTSKGKSGVEFRYYKPEEYRKLSKDQKAELREYRVNNQNEDDKSKNNNPKGGKNVTKRQLKKQVISVLKSLTKEEEESSKQQSELEEYIISVVKGMNKNGDKEKSKKSPGSTSTLKAIAKRLNKKKSQDDDDEE